MSQVNSQPESIRLGQTIMSSSYIIRALKGNKLAIHLRYRGETHTNPLHCYSSNARGSSQSNPVHFAIESSPRSDFPSSTQLGVFDSSKTAPQDVALNTVIYPGIIYLRIRATDAIPGGANYVACNETKLIGTSVSFRHRSRPRRR